MSTFLFFYLFGATMFYLSLRVAIDVEGAENVKCTKLFVVVASLITVDTILNLYIAHSLFTIIDSQTGCTQWRILCHA